MVVELRPFILHGAGLVEGLRPFVSLFEIETVAGLVAKAPDDDAGMVEVAADHTLHPYHMGGCKVVALCKRLLAVAHSVRLDVGLVDDIQAVAVAELVPEGVVGVVAGTYSVDIQLLHHAHVAQHLLSRHAVRPVRAHLVTVHALDEYGPAVDQQLRVLDFHAAETHVQAGGFDGFASGERAHAEGVEIGLLGAPEPRVFEDSVPAGAAVIDLFRPANDAAVGRGEFIEHGVGTGLHGHVEVVFTFHIRVHAHVAKGSALCPEVQAHAAGYAAEAPEVLALKVSAVAPAHYLECDKIVTLAHEAGNVECGLQLAVFTIADALPVDPHAHIGRGAAYAEHHAGARLLCGEPEIAAVLPHVVMFRRHVGGIVLKMAVPGVAVVGVDRVPVAVELPDSGHRHCAPAGIVEFDGLEAAFALGVAVKPAEFPGAVQAQGGAFATHAGAHREPAGFIHIRVLPVRQLLGGTHKGRRAKGCAAEDTFQCHKFSMYWLKISLSWPERKSTVIGI